MQCRRHRSALILVRSSSLEMDPGSDTDKVPAKRRFQSNTISLKSRQRLAGVEQLVKAGKDGLTSFG